MKKIKVLHVLGTSIPALAGYTIRAKNIIETERDSDTIEPLAVTSPKQPQTGPVLEKEIINSVTYYRSRQFGISDNPVKEGWERYRRKFAAARYFRTRVIEVCRAVSPDIIHAHSPFYCGEAGLAAANAFNIPMIYEMRSLWEQTAQASSGLSPLSIKFNYIRFVETGVVRKADAVVAICEHLKDEIVSRRIESEKIFVVPNGVDTDLFHPLPKKDETLLNKYHLEGKTVFGYIGTIRKLEGLHFFLPAFARLLKIFPAIKMLIIGGGEEKAEVEKIAQRLGTAENVIFVGSVPHEKILNYYSIIDVAVFPRTNDRVCHSTTPLKPLEAMAVEKTVLGSRVGGLQELIADGQTGLLFEAENIDDIVQKCCLVIRDGRLRSELARNGREWVTKERDWRKIVPAYVRIYNGVLERFHKLIKNKH